MNQLGILQNTPFKTHHKRMEYIILQIYLVNLLLGRDFELNQSKNKKKKFNLGLSNSKKINSYDISGADLIIMWILLFNSGHLNGTFAAEKALLKYIKENESIYKKFECNMPDEIKDNFKKCIYDEDTYNLHKFLIIFTLTIHYKQAKKTKKRKFINLLIKICVIYFISTDERYLKFKNYFNKIRRISYLFLDSQYAEFPITFKLTSILLNLDEYVEHLLNEQSYFNKTLNSVDALISHNLYYSKDSISEFNYYSSKFYDFLKNDKFDENNLKNQIIEGYSFNIKQHDIPPVISLVIDEDENVYEGKASIQKNIINPYLI